MRHNIRTQNSRLFTENRFFHSQNCARPNLQAKGLKSPGGRNLLMHYLNAPGNLLFLSTNLLGLGILITYRGLSTVANADRMNNQEQHIHATEMYKNGLMDFDYSDEKFNLLKRQLMQKHQEVEEEEFNEMIDEHIRELEEQECQNDEATVGAEIRAEEFKDEEEAEEEAYALPLTEMDLDEYGPPVTRGIKEERFKTLLVDQLLSVYCISDFFDQVFLSKTPNMELLESLSKNAKEGLVSTLYDIMMRHSDASSLEINTFEEFFKNLPLRSIHHFLEDAFAIELKHELLQFNDAFLKDESLENTVVETSSKPHNSKSIENILNQKNELDSEMYLNVASEIINSKGSSSVYEPFIEKSNENPKCHKDRNLKNFASILNTLYFHTGSYKNEKSFNELMKSSIILKNKRGFYEGLKHLNIDESSLQDNNWRLNKKVRSHLAQKSKEHGYHFSIGSYIIALQGLIKFSAPREHIKNVVDKVLRSLVSSGDTVKVLFKNGVTTQESSTLLSKIPVELFELFIKISHEYKDNIFLTWCFQLLNKYYNNVSTDVYLGLQSMLKRAAISLNNRELLQRIDEEYK